MIHQMQECTESLELQKTSRYYTKSLWTGNKQRNRKSFGELRYDDGFIFSLLLKNPGFNPNYLRFEVKKISQKPRFSYAGKPKVDTRQLSLSKWACISTDKPLYFKSSNNTQKNFFLICS